MEGHIPDPSCECNHGKSIHTKDCDNCRTDFCHDTKCGCQTFVARGFKRT